MKSLIPRPIFIEIGDKTLSYKELGGEAQTGDLVLSYIKRPSGKVISYGFNTKKEGCDSFTLFSLRPEDESMDISALKILIKKVSSSKIALTKPFLIWNISVGLTNDIPEQIKRLSFAADARDYILLNEVKSLINENFIVGRKLDYKVLSETNTISTSTKSLYVLGGVIIFFTILMYFRIKL